MEFLKLYAKLCHCFLFTPKTSAHSSSILSFFRNRDRGEKKIWGQIRSYISSEKYASLHRDTHLENDEEEVLEVALGCFQLFFHSLHHFICGMVLVTWVTLDEGKTDGRRKRWVHFSIYTYAQAAHEVRLLGGNEEAQVQSPSELLPLPAKITRRWALAPCTEILVTAAVYAPSASLSSQCENSKTNMTPWQL